MKIKNKKIKLKKPKKLPGILTLIRDAFQPLGYNRKLFWGFILLQFVLNLLFVVGINSIFSFSNIKQQFEDTAGNPGGVSKSFSLLGYAVDAGSGNSGYQLAILLISSLAIIWGIRQTLAGRQVGLKQIYYQGVYPLVPFLLVMLVIAVQLLPLSFGNFILLAANSNGLAHTFFESALWWLIFIALSSLTIYWLASSIFALYISTLPDMTPLKALRSARGLVRRRRLNVIIRLLVIPVLIMLVYIVILVPIILIVPVLTIPIFALLGSFGLFYVHSYLYNLYRSLL